MVQAVLDPLSNLLTPEKSSILLALLPHTHVLIYKAEMLIMMLKSLFGTKTLMDTNKIFNGQLFLALMEPIILQALLTLTSFSINMVLIMIMVEEFQFGIKIPMDTKEISKSLLKTEEVIGGQFDSFTPKNVFTFRVLSLIMQLRSPNGTMLNKTTLNGNSLSLNMEVEVATSRNGKTHKYWQEREEDVILLAHLLLMLLLIYKVEMLIMMLQLPFGIRTLMDTNKIFNGSSFRVQMEPTISQALLTLTSFFINLVLIMIMVAKFQFGIKILMDIKEIFKFDLKNVEMVTS